jgi:hypothetical protein
MSKSIFKKEPVPFEFNGETYELVMCRVYIQAGPVMAYRKLINGLPGQQEVMQAAADLSEYQYKIEQAQEEAKQQKLSEADAEKHVMAAVPDGVLSQVMELRRKQIAIENENAQEIYNAKLDVLLPALMSWDISDGELQLPDDRKDIDAKRRIFQEYGSLGEMALEAMWSWYNPTTADSAATTEATPTDGSTSAHSSSPATENSENSTPSLLLTK